jgi:hypothetical protein
MQIVGVVPRAVNVILAAYLRQYLDPPMRRRVVCFSLVRNHIHIAAAMALFCSAGSAPAGNAIVASGALWRYYKGYSTPAAQGTNLWFHPGYDVSGWSSPAPSGFGYADADDATVLADMQDGYASVFLLTTFVLGNADDVTRLNLRADYDDGFVAYLNGVEVARRNLPPGPVDHTTLALADHDPSCSTNDPLAEEPEWIAVPASLLRDGTNVLAVSGHNLSAESSDFSLLVELFTNVCLTRGPYVQFPDTQSISIVWRTAAEVDTVLAYGPDPGCALVLSNGAPTREHEATITGWPHGEPLFYSIRGGGEELRGPTSVRTPRPKGAPLRLAVVGDFGTSGTGAAAVAACVSTQAVDALLTVGDNIYAYGCAREYDPYWFGPYAELMARAPTFPALGNHDQYVGNGRWLPHFFRLPTNGPPGWLERVYSKDVGDAHVVVLDTNPFELGDAPAVEAITAWLTNDLEQAQGALWRIVLLHHPPRTSTGGHAESLAVQALSEPLFARYRVDLVLQGHNHWYERLNPIDGVQYVTTGAGGRSLNALVEQPSYSSFLEQNRFSFSLIEIDGPHMLFRQLGTDGAPIDAANWDKTRFRMDGLMDDEGWGRATNGLKLHAAIRGPDLYVATQDAGEGSDHFIYLASQLSSNRPANWSKGGQVMQWSALLTDEDETGFHQWLGPDGETWLAHYDHYRHVTSGLDDNGADGNGVLEGTIDLAYHFGSFPELIYIAVAPYRSTNQGHLVAASQVPAGNGDENLDAAEFLALPTRQLALDLPFAHAGTGATIEAGMRCLLDGSASASPSHLPLSFRWSLPEASPGLLAMPTNALSGLLITQQVDSATNLVAQLAVHDGRFGETSSVVVVVVPWTDFDGDGLSDAEEQTGADNLLTQLDPEGRSSDPQRADTDDDGFADGAEAVAGTDPRAAASRPQFSDLRLDGSGLLLSWPSATGRFYTIRSASGVDGIYAPIHTDLIAGPPLNTCTVAPPDVLRFFLLETRK